MRDFLDYASTKYYSGNPVITDDEFDSLAKQHNYERVGARITNGIAHHFPMYSLQKVYVGEELIKLPGQQVVTRKLDGAAASLLYFNGKFIRGLTRGDGVKGLDCTENLRTIVPATINGSGFRQVTGEVVALATVENSRNVAAGALSLKSVEEFERRELSFIAHGVQPYYCAEFSEDMAALRDLEFNTVMDDGLDVFPQDGKVYRINENEIFDSLGFTRKHPRGAFALKEVKEGITTQLLDVVWQVGRSGVVSPVAILAPAKIGGAEVKRATLHNFKYIEKLGLEIGCDVEIIRSGEIIPRVVRRV